MAVAESLVEAPWRTFRRCLSSPVFCDLLNKIQGACRAALGLSENSLETYIMHHYLLSDTSIGILL